MRLICSRCGDENPPTATFGCDSCGGPLEVEYERPLSRDSIEDGGTLFDRYGERLPSAGSVAGIEGDTPLLPGDALVASLDGQSTVYLKDERRNPTGSFKDRALAPAISLAAETDCDAVLTASTGNAAAACAHYAARAGLACYLLVTDAAPEHKLIEPRAYGARTVRVRGLFDGGEDALATLLETLSKRLDAYCTFAYRPFNPVLEEGVKTVAYEVAEALDWTAPDVVVTATGGGDNLSAQYRGYRELRDAGLIDAVPRMVAAQTAGASPVVDAVEAGTDTPVAQDGTDTVASGIDAPFAGAHALTAIRESGGTAVAVTDDALIKGEATLARTTGVWAEPASSVVVPALEELVVNGWIEPDETVALTVTGSGYKHTEPFADQLAAIETVERDPDQVAAAFAE